MENGGGAAVAGPALQDHLLARLPGLHPVRARSHQRREVGGGVLLGDVEAGQVGQDGPRLRGHDVHRVVGRDGDLPHVAQELRRLLGRRVLDAEERVAHQLGGHGDAVVEGDPAPDAQAPPLGGGMLPGLGQHRPRLQLLVEADERLEDVGQHGVGDLLDLPVRVEAQDVRGQEDGEGAPPRLWGRGAPRGEGRQDDEGGRPGQRKDGANPHPLGTVGGAGMRPGLAGKCKWTGGQRTDKEGTEDRRPARGWIDAVLDGVNPVGYIITRRVVVVQPVGRKENSPMRRILLIAVATAALASSPPLWAQRTTGSITGDGQGHDRRRPARRDGGRERPEHRRHPDLRHQRAGLLPHPQPAARRVPGRASR